jgi:hypothetical protein
MAMLEKHRNVRYNHFAPTLGEEVTQALMSQFPSRDVDEPSTKADLDLVRADLTLTAAALRADLLLTEARLRTEIEAVKTDVQRMMNRQTVFLTTVIGVAVGIVLGAG